MVKKHKQMWFPLAETDADPRSVHHVPRKEDGFYTGCLFQGCDMVLGRTRGPAARDIPNLKMKVRASDSGVKKSLLIVLREKAQTFSVQSYLRQLLQCIANDENMLLAM